MRVLTDWLLTPQRAAVHLPSGTAVVADLHLGYDEARRCGGEAVPLRPLDEQLAGLRQALAAHQAHRLVVAGDLLEDGRRASVAADFLRWLDRNGVTLTGVVPGNHDRSLGADGATAPALPLFPRGIRLGGWRVVHGDGRLPRGPLVQGHEHPCVRWADRLGAPCYLVGPNRLILPAFSEDAAGVNVLGVKRWQAFRCCVIAGDRVLDFGPLAALHRRARW